MEQGGRRGTPAQPARSVESTLLISGVTDVAATLLTSPSAPLMTLPHIRQHLGRCQGFEHDHLCGG